MLKLKRRKTNLQNNLNKFIVNDKNLIPTYLNLSASHEPRIRANARPYYIIYSKIHLQSFKCVENNKVSTFNALAFTSNSLFRKRE